MLRVSIEKRKFFCHVVVAIVVWCFPFLSYSGTSMPSSFTYQGRFMNSSGTAPLTNNLTVYFEIRNPSGACLLYSERQNINTTTTGGLFAVRIGEGIRNNGVAGYDNDPGYQFSDIFTNKKPFSTHASCSGGWIPGANDARILKVHVWDGALTITLADQTLTPVPQALVADTIDGVPLQGLTLSWTTATRPTHPVTGQHGYNDTLRRFEKWNGTTWVPTTPKFSPAVIADIHTDKNVMMWDAAADSGAGAWVSSSLGTLLGNPDGDVTGTYDNMVVQGIQGRDILNTAPNSGQVLKWNGTAWAPADDSGVADGTATGQILRWNGTAWVVATGVSVDGSGYITLPGAPTNNDHAATKVYVDNAISALDIPPVLDGTADGEILVWDHTAQRWEPTAPSTGGTTISGTAHYIPKYNSAGDNLENSIIFQDVVGGEIGINNTNPSHTLDVNGTVRGVNTTNGYGIYGVSTGNGGSGVLGTASGNNAVGLLGSTSNAGGIGVSATSTNGGLPFLARVYIMGSATVGTTGAFVARAQDIPVTSPTIGFGGRVDLRASGNDVYQYPSVASITYGWENAQTNNTTDRDGYLSFSTTLDNANSSAGGSERMRITSTGNVGINTIDPNEKLTVSGNLSLAQQGSAPSATADFGKLYVSGDGAAQKIYFKNENNDVFDLTSTGSGGISSLGGLTDSDQLLSIGTSGNSPAWSSATDTHTLNIPLASASGTVTAGLISNAEYTRIPAAGTANDNTLRWNGTSWVDSDGVKIESDGDVVLKNAPTANMHAATKQYVDSAVSSAVTDVTGGDAITATETLGVIDIDVNVDNTTIEINSDQLRIKDGGVDLAKLANGTTKGQVMQWSGTAWQLSNAVVPGNNEVLTWDTSLNAGNGGWKAAALPAGLTISGTQNYLSKFNAAGNNVINSQIFDDGTNVGIGTATLTQKLTVNGDADINGVVVGRGAGNSFFNVVVGNSAMTSNTSGSRNIAIGYGALNSNATSGDIIAIGYNALAANTSSHSIAIGSFALSSNTTGGGNTAVGHQALSANETGNYNTAFGRSALQDNTNDYNTAVGDNALRTNTSGSGNTSLGYSTLTLNTTGSSNTAIGRQAIEINTTGGGNVGLGESALRNIETGSLNTSMGYYAGFHASTNSTRNVFIGSQAGPSSTTALSNKLYIDNSANDTPLIYGDFSNDFVRIHNMFELPAIAEPATPASGYGRFYVKADGKPYFKNDGGTEYDLSASGGGGGISSLEGLTDSTIDLQNGSTGTAPAWSTASGVITLNIPMASTASVTAGLLSKTDYDRIPASGSTTNNTMRWSGTAWVQTDGAQITSGGDVILKNGPTANMHAATKQYVDTAIAGTSADYVAKAGDTMTGPLTLDGMLSLKETTTPSATTDYGKVYAKNDGKLYFMNDAGTEHDLTGSGGNAWSLKTAATYTAVIGDRLFVDTTSNVVTITLPASANIGDTVYILHVGGDLTTNKIVIGRNGHVIMGLAEDMDVTTNNVGFELIYADATRGWRIK